MSTDSVLDYRADIDGLRALAVSIVVVYHAFPSVLPGGFVGVDIFFVISGFLITSITAREIDNGTFSISSFYLRRARRLFPALSVLLVSVLIFGWFALRADELRQLAQHVVAGVTFTSNILLWQETGYFDTASDTKPLLHLWSLSVEEQFYLLFPLVLLLSSRLKRSRIRWTCLLWVSSFAVSLVSFLYFPTAGFFLPFSRFWEILTGALIALVMFQRQHFLSRLTHGLRTDAVALALMLLGVVTGSIAGAYPGAWALLPVLGAMLFIATPSSTSPIRKFFRARPVVALGKISYPLYLWHWPLLVLPRLQRGAPLDNSEKLLMLSLSVIAAALTYRLLEIPLRTSRVKAGNSPAYVLLGLMIAIASVAGLLVQADGAKGRDVDRTPIVYRGDIGHDDFPQLIDERYERCTDPRLVSGAEYHDGVIRCHQSKSEGVPQIALVGDSHAEHLFIGVAEQLSDHNVVYLIRNQQISINNPWYNGIFDYLLSSSEITTVIISSFWLQRGVQVEDLAATTQALIRSGKRVILTDDVPNFSIDPTRCSLGVQCEELGFWGRYWPYRDQLDAALARVPGAQFVSTVNVFCRDDLCSMGSDGLLYYRDQHHLNINGSRRAGSHLATLLLD